MGRVNTPEVALVSKVWIVYEPGGYVSTTIIGVYRSKRAAQADYNTERENLRAAGNLNWTSVQMEQYEVWPPRTKP